MMHLVLFCVAILLLVERVVSHGMMTLPKSRNVVAFELGLLGSQYDATALNNNIYTSDFRSSSVCGQVQGGGDTGMNYDTFSVEGKKTIEEYKAGQTMTVDITLTVHHMGHFEFSLCPVPAEAGSATEDDNATISITPSQDCFRDHKLEIAQDLVFGAPLDPNYPERAMIPPLPSGAGGTTDYSYDVVLPGDVPSGDYVLKWMYVTGNSCYPTGYTQYQIPTDWNFQYDNMLPECDVYDLSTPLAIPEIFLSCADIRIINDGSSSSSAGGTTTTDDGTTDQEDVPSTESDASGAPRTSMMILLLLFSLFNLLVGSFF